LGRSFGASAYRAMMLGSPAEPEVMERISAFAGFTWPSVQAFPSQGALKFTSLLEDGTSVESVILRNRSGRTSLCLSVQAGCRMGCSFCATGASGFSRDLKAAEIVGQVLSARRYFSSAASSVVLMGMGDALDNYEQSMAALRILSDEGGLCLPITRMTLSTCGIAPGIERLAAEAPPRPKLAVSLHAVDDSLRRALMPGASAYSLARLKDALSGYARRTGSTVFIEYLLLSGVNDAPGQAHALADYLRGLPVKVNLLSYNQAGRGEYRASSPEAAGRFKRVLRESGLFVHDRVSKGSGAQAACGQLGRSPAQQGREGMV
jgi:23S rRNA (adenine2503-C2)-methyltransferase